MRWLGRYLIGTRDKGTIIKPKKNQGLELYVDASFAGDYFKEDSTDPHTARSRFGYYVTYAGCPVSWKSQLATEICLSTTEAEYTGLSYALREAIPMMEILAEMKRHGYDVDDSSAKCHLKVYEDNSGALEIAKNHKYRARTKHLNQRLHFFRSYVNDKQVEVLPIGTADQPADILSKCVNEVLLLKHRLRMMGWS